MLQSAACWLNTKSAKAVMMQCCLKRTRGVDVPMCQSHRSVRVFKPDKHESQCGRHRKSTYLSIGRRKVQPHDHESRLPLSHDSQAPKAQHFTTVGRLQPITLINERPVLS